LNRIYLYFHKLKTYWFPVFISLFLIISIFVTTSQVQKRQNTTTKAATSYPADLSGKFKEMQVLNLTSASQIYGYFTTDHKSITPSQSLPSTISLSNGAVTFQQKGGIIIANPLKNESFYKIEVTMTDADQTSLESYLTPIDNLWASGVTTNGISIGINTTKSGRTYWNWHTQLKQQGQIPDDQYNWSMAAHSKFIRRQAGPVKLEIYVTPNGSYAVVNGANFGSFPNTYLGAYTYRNGQPLNYIALAKWNDGGNTVTFQNLKVIKLDNVINNIDEVNAYFIKRTVESSAFLNTISQTGGANGSSGYGNALWAAFLYRAYDYYFKTNHVADVQNLVDTFLQYFPADVDTNLARYGKEDTLAINHSFINNNNAVPMVVYGLGSYLRPDQKTAFQTQLGKIIDKSEQYITVKFPNAPCAGKTAGQCVFDTRLQVDVNGKSIESITAYGKFYNWDMSADRKYYVGWPSNGSDLTSVTRYVAGPCSGKTAGTCKFDSRAYFTMSDGSIVESITAYGKAYNWNISSDWKTYTPWPNNGFDLTGVSFYSAGPCSGRSAGTCTFDTRTQVKINGQLIDSVTAYGKGYNWYPDLSPWPNNGFDLTTVTRYAAGPCSGKTAGTCKFDSRAYFTMSDGSIVESITAYGKAYNWNISSDWKTYTPWPNNGFDLTGVFRYIGENEKTSFPYGGENYKADTFAEEVSWLLTLYAGYYVNFPQDNPRSAKILDYLKFFGFHHASTGQSLRQAYGNTITFTYLPDSWRDFVTQYIWLSGEVDNHNFHPSGYALGIIGASAIVRNALAKNGVTIPTLSSNIDLIYQKNVIEYLDINTLRLKRPKLLWDTTNTNLVERQDYYLFASDGSVLDFAGYSRPSLVEDWGTTFTNYSIIEYYGDYNLSLPFARNIYYSYYSGAGKLFCGHQDTGNGQLCSAGTNNFYNYLFGDGLYAMLFSPRSSFDPRQGPPPTSTPATPTNTPVPPTNTPPVQPTNTPTPTKTPTPTPLASKPSCSGGHPTSSTTSSTAGVFRVYADGVSNATSVKFPTWTSGSGQDDIIWYNGTNAGGGTWYADVDLAKHQGIDTINVHIYMDNATNTNVWCGSANFTRIAPLNSGGNGLIGTYYDNPGFTGGSITRTDSTINFDWQGGSPNSAIGADTFSARWTGQIVPQYSQTYTFYTVSDDGVRLWVNNQLVVDSWVDQSPTEHSGNITLTAGQKYNIKMEYYENGGGAVAKLLWSSPSTLKQTVPQSQLLSTLPPVLAPGCILSDSTWKNSLFSQQTGTFTAAFDATPNNNLLDTVIGLSNGAASSYANLAAIARFNPKGYIDARNGSSYEAANSIPYTSGVIYHFRMVIDTSSHKYSAYVTPKGGTEQLIGNNFLFRTEQAKLGTLNNLAMFTVSPNTITLCNFALSGTSVNGLMGIYYDNSDFTGASVIKTDGIINFDWGGGSPDARIGPDNFSTRWTGQIAAPYSGVYTFYTRTDDGVRLWVNNQLIINKWIDQSPTEWSGTISLTAGQKYPLKMEYYENGGGAVAQLSWSGPNIGKQIVPQSQLFAY